VLIITPLTPAAVDYYFRGQAAGRWVGQGVAGLGLAGSVERGDLAALLRGCRPGDGAFLPAARPARRRAGWDLTLAAPKSISLLAGVAIQGGAALTGAHAAAVADVVEHFELRLLALRRGSTPRRTTPPEGLVAAAFHHRVNAADDPHLHTHLIVCNLGRGPDGVWSPIHSSWWTQRASLGAIYQLSLRHHLEAQGLGLPWRLRDDGFAEVIAVPRAALRAASGRSRAAAADRAAFGDAAGGRTVGIRAAATAQSRDAMRPGRRTTTPGDVGFGPEEAGRLLSEARAPAKRPAGPGLEQAVTARLAGQRSTFRITDVLVALAACTPGGFPAAAAWRWAAGYCDAARPVPSPAGWAPRWTTPLALVSDERLWACARRMVTRRARHAGDAGLDAYPDLDQQGLQAARALLAGDRSLHVLQAASGHTNLLAQAAVLEAAGAAWSAGGQRVVVATSSDQAATRWRILTGLSRQRSGPPADVVVVDHADRRPTPELLSLLMDIDRTGAHAVLLEGGTMPRLSWRPSAALAAAGDHWGRLDPGPAPTWVATLQRGCPPPRISPGPVGCSTARAAVQYLLAAWDEAGSSRHPAALVGLGYAEVDGLNQAARAQLVARGHLTGPQVVAGGRAFQAGDRMVALRRLAPGLAPGATASIVEVDARRRTARVSWDHGNAVLDRSALSHAGYAYALTPGLAARIASPLLVLGPPEIMGPHRARVRGAALVHQGARWGMTHDRMTSLGLG
jgi:conjugative relaxase-like TrwC/TraI family protein